jgi:hypothetical protein
MNKKSKISEAKTLIAKTILPLTESELEFIRKYQKPGGLLILRNPDEQEIQMANELNEKGIDVVTIKRKIHEIKKRKNPGNFRIAGSWQTCTSDTG